MFWVETPAAIPAVTGLKHGDPDLTGFIHCMGDPDPNWPIIRVETDLLCE